MARRLVLRARAQTARRGQIKRHHAVEQPDQGDRAHQPVAPAVRAPEGGHVQAVVQVAQEWHQAAARQGNGRRIARARDLRRDGIDVDGVVVEHERLVRGRIGERAHHEGARMAFFQAQGHVIDFHARVGGGHFLRQHERRLQGTAARRFHDVGVEPLVQFVVPRCDGAREARDDEEEGDGETGPAVYDSPESAHAVQTFNIKPACCRQRAPLGRTGKSQVWAWYRPVILIMGIVLIIRRGVAFVQRQWCCLESNSAC
ncbi:hypothetical protein D3C72_881610 [compost metagenome]